MEGFPAFWQLIWQRDPPYWGLLQQTAFTLLEDILEEHEQFATSAWYACKGRKMFQTKAGYLGLGPRMLQQGDLVFILFGGKTPYLLRPNGTGYKLVGECYVDGMMRGEVQHWVNQGTRTPRSVDIC